MKEDKITACATVSGLIIFAISIVTAAVCIGGFIWIIRTMAGF